MGAVWFTAWKTVLDDFYQRWGSCSGKHFSSHTREQIRVIRAIYVLSDEFSNSYLLLQEKRPQGWRLIGWFGNQLVYLTAQPLLKSNEKAASVNFSMETICECLLHCDETVPNWAGPVQQSESQALSACPFKFSKNNRCTLSPLLNLPSKTQNDTWQFQHTAVVAEIQLNAKFYT